MLFSPFSVPVRYSAPEGKGIYVFPSSRAYPSGWGEPRRDENGAPITPGTPGGEFPNALIYKDGNIWRSASDRYRQLSGNISWWGPPIDPSYPEKGRHVLSYFGPRLRYFPDNDFFYGSRPEHNDIYYKGGYAAVAPGPVLGACIRTIDVLDPVTGSTSPTAYIFAVVLQSGNDVFYRKKWGYRRVSPPDMSDEARAREMASISQDNPNGWERIGSYQKPSDEHYTAETPWFFGETGQQCAAVRRRKITFNNGYEDKTEDMFERLKGSVTDITISVTNLGNSPPFSYKEILTKEVFDHVSVDYAGYTHDWHEDHLTVRVRIDGEQYVLCEFIGDELYWGKLKYATQRIQEGYYTEGTDPSPYTVTYEGQPKDISNAGLREGPRMHDFYEYGYLDEDYEQSPGDHEYTLWINSVSDISLYYGPEGNEEENRIGLHSYVIGTQDQWEGIPQQDDLSTYFYEHITLYPRGMMDLRRPSYVAVVFRDYGLWVNGSEDFVDHHISVDNVLYHPDDQEGESLHITEVSSANEYARFGWPIVDVDNMEETFNVTLERSSYIGEWVTDNHEGDVQEPGSKTFYVKDTIFDLYLSWPTIPELLYGQWSSLDNGNGVGNGAITEKNEIGFSILCLDVKSQYTNNPVVSGHRPGGSMETLVGFGEKFYPVGVC